MGHYAVALQTSDSQPAMSSEGQATVSSPQWTPSTPTANGTYYLYIRADDVLDNQSAWVRMFVYVYDAAIDTSGPVMTIDVPDHPGLTYFVAWKAGERLK